MTYKTWGAMIACLSAVAVWAATEPAEEATKAVQEAAKPAEAEATSVAAKTESADTMKKSENIVEEKKTSADKETKKVEAKDSAKKADAGVSTKKATVSKRRHQPIFFNFGPEIAHFKYEEPGLMEEKGMQYGAFGEVSLPFPNHLLVRGFASFVVGDLDYDGGVQYADGSTKPLTLTTPNGIFNIRGTAGYTFDQLPIKITPYTGLGFRYLYNEIPDATVDGEKISGYKRNQYYTYWPLGVEADIRAGRWNIVPRGEFDLLLIGKHRAEMDNVDINMEQNSGYGFRGSVDIMSPEFGKSTTKMRVVIQPFVEYWNIEDSDTEEIRVGNWFSYYIVEFKEPENNSLLVGARASLYF